MFEASPGISSFSSYINNNIIVIFEMNKHSDCYFYALLSNSDNLRELCNTFRHLLYELAKCVSVCDKNLNASLLDELNKYEILQSVAKPSSRSASPVDNELPAVSKDLNQSTCSSIYSQTGRSMRVAIVPDVSGILSLIDDPSLVNFVAEKLTDSDNESDEVKNGGFDLNDCLEKLKCEADMLLQISEKLVQKKFEDNRNLDMNESIEEDDGLRSKRTVNLSFDSAFTSKEDVDHDDHSHRHRLSLPLFLPLNKSIDITRKVMSNPELNELRNRLVLAEQKKQELEKELSESLAQQNQLSEALRVATTKLNNYMDSQSEELSEG